MISAVCDVMLCSFVKGQ